MRDPVSDTLKVCSMSAWFLVLTSSPRDIEWLAKIRTAGRSAGRQVRPDRSRDPAPLPDKSWFW